MAATLDDSDLADGPGENADINVTPFIDVILVLLIIFMVAAPLSTVDVPVDLPGATAIRQSRPEKPVYITIKADLSIVLGEIPVRRLDLVQRLDALGEGGKDRRVLLRADRTAPYGELMDVLDRLRSGGYLKVALVAQENANAAPPAPVRSQ